MTTDPISSREESLNGSWVELNDAYSPSQSPIIMSPPEYKSKPLSLADSVQQLGFLTFQVDKILREAQLESSSATASGDPMYRRTVRSYDVSWSTSPDPDRPYSSTDMHHGNNRRPADCVSDALSDSISLVEAMMLDHEEDLNRQHHDTDWFWDWSERPEYFSKEWKMQQPVKRPLLSVRQWASKRGLLSSEVLSLLFLTNILSVIIGAGISYTILMRKSNL